MAFQILLLDIADHAPRDAQMMSDVLARHAFQEVNDISLECTDMASHRLGEGDVDLTQCAAVAALDAWDVEYDRHTLTSHGRRVKSPRFRAFEDNILASTHRTATAVPRLLDRDLDSAGDVFHPPIPISSDVVHMIQ